MAYLIKVPLNMVQVNLNGNTLTVSIVAELTDKTTGVLVATQGFSANVNKDWANASTVVKEQLKSGVSEWIATFKAQEIVKQNLTTILFSLEVEV